VFAGSDRHLRRHDVVHAEDALDFFLVSVAAGVLCLDPGSQRNGFGIVLDVKAPHHHHTLAEVADLRHVPLDPFDDQGTRQPVEHLPVTFTVRVRVIPVEAGGWSSGISNS
jgi:hypothetical protein